MENIVNNSDFRYFANNISKYLQQTYSFLSDFLLTEHIMVQDGKLYFFYIRKGKNTEGKYEALWVGFPSDSK